MLRQIITRLLAVLPILFGLSIFVFLLVHLAPGDVTDALLGPMATDEAKEKLRVALGLDRPLVVQYAKWIGQVLQGDFGISVHTQRAVSEVVLPRFGNTVILALASLLLALVVGFFVGMYAAARSYSTFDRVSMSVTLVVGSTPPYWLALLLVFAWPGLGNQLYYSIVARDVPVVQAAILIIALAFVLVNLAIDILNAFLDPRVRVV